ncbi:hypothetical protein LMG28614_05245 [Paraburkholderia ultramafica]|uniref:Uncharacterized protein n=1 Tax=Paraburkholderia ultramafica TaxID=1544867 RepID=A0A6S7BVV5_9BURK|nr:hypothetical protein LMG28614_05245 [Paraburkholderia ultramafica]
MSLKDGGQCEERNYLAVPVLMATIVAFFAENAFAQSETDNVNQSNSPLNLASSLNVQTSDPAIDPVEIQQAMRQ